MQAEVFIVADIGEASCSCVCDRHGLGRVDAGMHRLAAAGHQFSDVVCRSSGGNEHVREGHCRSESAAFREYRQRLLSSQVCPNCRSDCRLRHWTSVSACCLESVDPGSNKLRNSGLGRWARAKIGCQVVALTGVLRTGFGRYHQQMRISPWALVPVLLSCVSCSDLRKFCEAAPCPSFMARSEVQAQLQSVNSASPVSPLEVPGVTLPQGLR